MNKPIKKMEPLAIIHPNAAELGIGLDNVSASGVNRISAFLRANR